MLLHLIAATPEVDHTVYGFLQDSTMAEEMDSAGARVRAVGGRCLYDPLAFSRLLRKLSKSECDILHAHLPNSHVIGRLAANICGIDNIVCTHHSVPANYRYLSRNLETLTRRFDSTTVGVSEAIRNEMKEPSGSNWRTIHNGLDVERVAESVAAVDVRGVMREYGVQNQRVLLNVGRYVPVKNQAYLIRALENIPQTHLFLIGGGPEEDKIRDFISCARLDERVTLTGQVADVHRFYAIADIYVHSSNQEGFGLAILEAMAASLPVVATELPAVREIVVDGETGFIVSPDNPAEMVRSIRQLWDPMLGEKFGNAGYDRAKTHFHIRQTAEKYTDLYKSLLAEDEGVHS